MVSCGVSISVKRHLLSSAPRSVGFRTSVPIPSMFAMPCGSHEARSAVSLSLDDHGMVICPALGGNHCM